MTATLTPAKTRVNAARGLQRSEWAAYLDQRNRRDDLIAIGVGGHDERWPAVLWHYAEHPGLVHVAEHDDDPVTLTITSNDGTRTVLRFGAPDDE